MFPKKSIKEKLCKRYELTKKQNICYKKKFFFNKILLRLIYQNSKF